MILKRGRLHSRLRSIAAAVVALAFSLHSQTSFDPRVELTHVKLHATEAEAPGWIPVSAELITSKYDFTAKLRIRNVTDDLLHATRWYVEYFDGTGRLCFSKLFASEETVPGVGRGVTLSSSGSALAPTVKPESGLARLVPTGDVGGTLAMYISAPPELLSLPNSAGEYRPHPSPGLVRAGNQDLALVRVNVAQTGRVDGVEVLAAISADTSEWVAELSRKLLFVPCMQGGEPRNCPTLVLFCIRWPGYENEASTPWNMPWVKMAVAGMSRGNGDEFAMLPVMHTIAYMPQPVRSRSAEDAEVTHFELMTPASSWANWLLRSEYDRDWNAYLRKWQ